MKKIILYVIICLIFPKISLSYTRLLTVGEAYKINELTNNINNEYGDKFPRLPDIIDLYISGVIEGASSAYAVSVEADYSKKNDFLNCLLSVDTKALKKEIFRKFIKGDLKIEDPFSKTVTEIFNDSCLKRLKRR